MCSARPTTRPGDRSPAVVFFYGGGWLFGDIRRYQTQATHLALRGLVTVLVDYRGQVSTRVHDPGLDFRWQIGDAVGEGACK